MERYFNETVVGAVVISDIRQEMEPKMLLYFTERNGIYIIDLQKPLERMRLQAGADMRTGGTVLFAAQKSRRRICPTERALAFL